MRSEPDLDRLISAYHTLIDIEYRKYRDAGDNLDKAYLVVDEAIKAISSALGCDHSTAMQILDKLREKGFIISNGDEKIRSIHFDVAYRASNITIKHGSLRYPLEAKVLVRDEYIPGFSDHTFDELLKIIPENVRDIVRYAFSDDASIRGFSEFQYRAIESILRSDKEAYILISPTAGGKTYAFLIPVLIRILLKKLNNDWEEGVKALFIYPRKALERDQLQKIISILYRINDYFKNVLNKNVLITIGIDDGETEYKNNISSGSSFRDLLCPRCKGGDLRIHRIKDHVRVRCQYCGVYFDWIYASREDIWTKKPDILITNVWSLDYRLPSKVIQHDYQLYRNLEVVVLDEAHVYQSLLGGNVRYLIKRLKLSSHKNPTIILSSATIPSPGSFAMELLDLQSDQYSIVDAEKIGGRGRRKKVIYLVMAIHPYRSWETVIYELALLFASINYYRGMQGIIFIDSVRELYRIYSQARVASIHYGEPKDHFDLNEVPDPEDPYAYWPYMPSNRTFSAQEASNIFSRISLHHAGIKDREKIEKAFVEGRLGVLLSTSTLELGIDYPNVTFVTIVGVPFMIESVPQRIGRAGRNPERTLYTTLAIVILRNTPLELYYLYNTEALIEGFKGKDILVAWRNIAVKRYHILSLILDEMARTGHNTYILRPEGRPSNIKGFIDQIINVAPQVEASLNSLDATTAQLGDYESAKNILQELIAELKRIPLNINVLRKYEEHADATSYIFNELLKICKRLRNLAEHTNNANLYSIGKRLCRKAYKLEREIFHE